jgi:DNA-binding NarL/FixJ family response regulator
MDASTIEARVASQPTSTVAAPQPINLLIAADCPMDCQLFENALSHSRLPFRVVACAISQAEVMSSARFHSPDVALINERLNDGLLTGFELVRELRNSVPDTNVVVLARTAREVTVIDAFRAGARGFFCREEPVETLCKCIQAVHQGQIWANSAQLRLILDAFMNTTPPRLVSSKGSTLLTRREEDVVNLVVDGCPNREVAEKLDLTEHTVSNYLFRIYDKLGISNRSELILYSLGRIRKSENCSKLAS